MSTGVQCDIFVARPGGVADRCGERLRRTPPFVAALIVAAAGWVTLAALMISAGVALVGLVLPKGVGAWDDSVVRAFEDGRTGVLTDLSAVGSGLSDKVTVVVAGILLALVASARRAWALFGLIVLSLVVEITLYVAVTAVVHRRRPAVEPLELLRVDASFPSGHTAAAFALYFSIAAVATFYGARAFPRCIAWGAVVLIPLIVAVSRVYRGMHYPTDAIAGLAMGIGCVVVALFAVRTAQVVARSRSCSSSTQSTVKRRRGTPASTS